MLNALKNEILGLYIQFFTGLFQALGQWGWSKKRVGDERDRDD